MRIMKLFTLVLIVVAGALPVFSDTNAVPPGGTTNNNAAATVAEAANTTGQPTLAETSKLSEDLIYSVDRTPERLFETPRSVSVITIDDLWRKSGRSLADILANEAGIIVAMNQYTSASPVVRGLSGKQVMILLDGVKINSSTYGTTREYLNFIDTSMIERIEVVRGVVSVLGTESLGGVVNIITRKGPAGGENFGVAAVARYSSANRGFNTPVQLYGKGQNYRYFADVNFVHAGDVRAGEDVGRIANSGYEQRGGAANFQYLMSPEKTLTLLFTRFDENDVRHASSINSGTSIRYEDTPIRLQTTHVSFDDITSRSFADSLVVAASWTHQETGQERIRTSSASTLTTQDDRSGMYGLNLELGKFLGAHHLVYGLDYSTEKVRSAAATQNLVTSVVTEQRGNFLDGARYQTMGVYLNDRFDAGKWLTATAGVRYGSFRSSGSEALKAGSVTLNSSIDSTKSDLTGAVNLMFHAGSHVNFIVNGLHGFRAPNIEEMSHYTLSSTTVELPAPNLDPEKVNSFETGVKFEGGPFAFSGFYFRNRFSNLIARFPSTYNGLSFLDYNGNGVRDGGEPTVQQNQNRDQLTQKGYELEVKYRLGQSLLLRSSYTYFDRADTRAIPTPHDAIGTALLRYTFVHSSTAPWVELENLFETGSTTSLTTGIESSVRRFHELNLRAGMIVSQHLRLTGAIQNLRDRDNRYVLSTGIYQPGRQFLLSTEWKY